MTYAERIGDVNREDALHAAVSVAREGVSGPELLLRERGQSPLRIQVELVTEFQRDILLQKVLDAHHQLDFRGQRTDSIEALGVLLELRGALEQPGHHFNRDRAEVVVAADLTLTPFSVTVTLSTVRVFLEKLILSTVAFRW